MTNIPYLVTEDNVKIYYEKKGRGKAVILIHGWSCSRLHFKKQVESLKQKYQVISYDLRGHGASDRCEQGLTMSRMAKDLQELIDYLELDNVSLVGWSMGSYIIYEYIKQNGCTGLDKICLIDMTPKFINDDDWQLGMLGRFSYKQNLKVLSLLCHDWLAYTYKFVPSLFAKSRKLDPYEELWYLEEAQKNTPHVMINLWIAMGSEDYRSILPKITVPCLITYGEESQLYLPEASEYLHKNIPNSQLIAFPGCGHGLHLEEPDKFNRVLINFLG